jgi:hypothetical protein
MAKTEPILLGRNDYPAKLKNELVPSTLVEGMQAVKADEHGKYGTRTGRNERQV